ncbi:MAG TPA: MotA/TolQ/ExbB proton channel family protein [Gemmatimonadales bacterium]|jgi:biopolymer transport protein TolQ|nr:MotA/TolQ/ExbB proton channel family protein [Gemmatimonadales bacterium]
MILLQAPARIPTSPWELVLTSSPETKIVLVVTIAFSLASWFLIGVKYWQFRRLRRQAARFLEELGRSPRLQEAYRSVMKLPPSPFNRLFREGLSFYTQLQPGVLREEGTGHGALSPSQLEALKMVLGKGIAEERDEAAKYVTWLATIGAVSPLLGLLGTVLGVMDAFIGISVGGSGNLAAVAPGVAEALVTTVAGLASAIPALIAYNIFSSKVGEFESELEGFGNALVGWMAREGLL